MSADLKNSVDKLKQAIEQLGDDRERQLEIYSQITEVLFGTDSSVAEGRIGLLDPEMLETLVNLLNNMTSSSKTLADISKSLFEITIIKEDLNDPEDQDKENPIDRKKALRMINKEE